MAGLIIPCQPSDEDLQVLEMKSHYRFTNRLLIREALQASSGFNQDGHKTLAMIGDSILRLVLVTHGYYGKQITGQISDTISKKASTANLSKQGFDLGIDKFIVKNSQPFVGPNVMATTTEAIVGAVYVDCNQQIQPCAVVMSALGVSP
ncbi:hypothetical protein PENCOP_c003G03419 [Penicillium coprophilum]|uniref:RNase III domain-containing protein n=1 Tax=Penicillium coprophilum TaxID=36646 RepID=A0A1V6UZ07_9EURO|nr:hypothetical protein PENCOP_c003G03419 [Penicillium coprophilum]